MTASDQTDLTNSTDSTHGQRIIFLDVDGTIMEAGIAIAPSTPTAIQTARRNGHLLFLCTGRALADIPDEVLEIGFDGAITNAGGNISLGDRTVFERTLTPDEATVLLTYLDENDSEYLVQSPETSFISPGFLDVVRKLEEQVAKEEGVDNAGHLVDWLSSLPLIATSDLQNLSKVAFTSPDPLAVEKADEALGDQFHVVKGSLKLSLGVSGEVGPRGITKGDAIQRVLKELGIPALDAVGVGDSFNDVEMFEVCGTAVAMGNAEPELKKLADLVTTECLDDGIHNAFVALGLI